MDHDAGGYDETPTGCGRCAGGSVLIGEAWMQGGKFGARAMGGAGTDDEDDK